MSVLSRFLDKGLITPEVEAEIESLVVTGEETYESALSKRGVSSEQLREIFAAEYGVPALILQKEESVTQTVLRYIPEESARHYLIMPIRVEDDVLIVAANDPENLQVREVLNFISARQGLTYKLVYMLESDIQNAFTFYESLTGEVDEALTSLDTVERDEVTDDVHEDDDSDLTHIKEDAPVTKIVATILRYAVDGAASDIHIEPTASKVVVRFRVDGLLSKSLELPQNVQSAVVARVKILSSIRLDEKRKPQDGRFSANFDGRKIDFRVSVLPTNHGEKVVMRILDNEQGVSSLSDTGISERDLKTIQRMVKEPFGIILISGPTGSGKSTTLYGMIKEIDSITKNVISLEDPVEYNIENVSQSQIRPEIGYTFASGLRSVLRQDPDVIMVGEIRDKETAQLAIQAALTGHLVLSTIHTNNSMGVVPRLVDMGIDPYLIAPTLKLAIAQRLARRVCPGTGKELPFTESMKLMIADEFKDLPERYRDRIPADGTFVTPQPSPGCASGTKGRVAVMEILEVDEEIQDLILKGGSEDAIYTAARKKGFMSMKEDAIVKALGHVIPYEEVSNFGTKVGLENILDENQQEPQPLASALPVDNPTPEEPHDV